MTEWGEFYTTQDEEEEEDNALPHWIEGDSLAPPCQSEIAVVKDILELAQVSEQDTLYDLGCGDGRICIAAATQYCARAVGVEIEQELIEKFKAASKKFGVEDRVQV